MAWFRRTLFGFIAALALFCGFGWTVAAAAYSPISPAISASHDQSDDDCGKSAPPDCPIPYCGPVCLGVTPEVPVAQPVTGMPLVPYRTELQALHDNEFGPEPPPPRRVRS